jgi:hypothetical protein
MKLDSIKQVLTFQAFRPDPDDPDTPVAVRMAGRRYVCVNISKGHVSWRGVDRKGKMVGGGQVEGEFADVVSQLAEEWHGHSDGGWVVVSINNRFVLTLESNLSRKPGSERLIRSNARAVIGAKHDRTKRYAVYHHPETSSSLLLACEDSLVKTIEDSLEGLGLKPARVSCGLFSMVEDWLRRHFAAGGAKKDFVLVACCDGSICVLSQKKGQWSELRARGGFYAGEDAEPVVALAAPLINGSGAGSPIYLLHDRPGTMFSSSLLERLESHGAKDVTEPEMLWSALTQN